MLIHRTTSKTPYLVKPNKDHVKPELLEWENEGGATLPPREERSSLRARLSEGFAAAQRRVVAEVKRRPLAAVAGAVGIGLLIGARLKPFHLLTRVAGHSLVLSAVRGALGVEVGSR